MRIPNGKMKSKRGASSPSAFVAKRGRPLPLGATPTRLGVNFAVFSSHATAATLVVFAQNGRGPPLEFPLDPRYNRTGAVWHVLILGLPSDAEYAYRMDGPDNSASPLHRFDPSRLLLDPYAKAISGAERWAEPPGGKTPAHADSGPAGRRSKVVDEEFNWEGDEPLNIHLADSIIYEMHVRGFTRHPSSEVEHPGAFLGVAEKIPYLKRLGITAVELMPITEFDELDNPRFHPSDGTPLLNYWGYNPIGFFAPKASYASAPGEQIHEFKTLVKKLHEAGIEVILDMVFNHTSEGDERGETNSFRGLDNSVYYLLDRESGEYKNFSGCGNTLNCNHPVVRDMILDCLRYWVTETHVDGFRFDLASIMGRGRDGKPLRNPPLLERIAADPVLQNTKLIAEAWDAAGLYQVGTFPNWGRWAEWNGKFRDDMRRFVKSDPGMARHWTTRMAGSPDLYQSSGRQPYHSINFITSHDGFTLADLVSYNEKHNLENGEDNADGGGDNSSWNCGAEGPAKDPEILALRGRQRKNLAAMLLLAQGAPMIQSGDELGRTQFGNNNAYCHDREWNWIPWDALDQNDELFRFFQRLIQFRKQHSTLRRREFFDENDAPDPDPIQLHGKKRGAPDGSGESRLAAMKFRGGEGGEDIYIAANAHWEPCKVELPLLREGRTWRLFLDTAQAYPNDIAQPGAERETPNQTSYPMGPRSLAVLVGRQA